MKNKINLNRRRICLKFISRLYDLKLQYWILLDKINKKAVTYSKQSKRKNRQKI